MVKLLLGALGEELVVPPPKVNVFPYPVAMSTVGAVLAVTILLMVAGRFDPTHGALTVSLLIVLAFIGTVTFCLFFTVPNDPTTAAVIGGLVAAMGATISYWLKPRDKP
jgi:uncharacterized BrkB/YihY/UPF0761 family membrane protein